MAQKMVFTDDWQAIFAKRGLRSFDDFFEYRGPQAENDSKRQISIITVGDCPGHKTFFIKRFHYSHFADAIFALRNFGRLCSQAQIEWENAKLLFDIGVETYRPVCYGTQTMCGLERKSVLVTEELQYQCFTDYVAGNWLTLSNQQREGIIISLAKLVRKVHDAEIGFTDLYVWHIFIREKANDNIAYDFALIDLHRMERNVRNRARQIKNLGRLNYSMLDKYFDQATRRLFVESYAGDDWPGDVAKLQAEVKKYSDALLLKRNQKPY
ncbi:MAG: lipopolysaccharide kinase InaA family protein [Planctomycetota bacterium]|jgi:hypothetical protein